MRRFDLRSAFSLALLCALGIGALLSSDVQPARAQMNAGSTWVNSGNVSGTNAVTLSGVPASVMTDLIGVPIRFIPANANAAGGTTVIINSIDAGHAVDRASGGSLVPIAGGDFSTTAFAEIIWDGTEFVETNPATGDAPVGSEIVLTGPTAPAGYLIENGACVSETTYAALYAYYGSSDIWSPGSTGGACSSGQFHVKFANGRASVASNTQGSQTGPLTNCTAGVAETCGAQDQTLATGNIPQFQFTPSGSVSVSASINGPNNYLINPTEGAGIGTTPAAGDTVVTWDTTIITASGSFSGNQITIGNASPSAITTVPLLNQNIFAVKY